MDPAQNSSQDPQNKTQAVPDPVVQAPAVGSVYKEHGPIPNTQPKTDTYLRPSGAEMTPEVPPEVAEHGVEVTPSIDAPKLTDEHRNIGVTHAKENVPVATIPSGAVQLPLTPQEAVRVVKLHKKVSDSVLWLATLIIKHAKVIHQKVKG